MSQNVTLRNPTKKVPTDRCEKCITREEMVELIRDGINSTFEAIFKEFKDEIKADLNKSIASELKKQIKSLLVDMERMKESQAGLQNDLEDAKQLICKLKSEIKNNVEQIEEIKSQVGKQLQWGRLNNLEIVGLPEKSNESLPDIIRRLRFMQA
ncbi:unnamed protein product [Leptidea sinapis]|uniref:Uncharacterized protein n=1 Tax=Leptidea sinapis TaxID=189913 RepID=A0A5E4PUG7_9NEOP|nr:unnamed protein product [Leptidea sinapis]